MAKNNTEQFSKELLDQLLAGREPKSVLDSGGLIGDLKKALAERMLNAEMDVHLAREADAGGSQPPEREQRQDRADVRGSDGAVDPA